MITRVEIDGFKSLRGFAVDLEPLTAIVGPNGAGKSNLFDALQLLSQLATTGMNSALALRAMRGGLRDLFSRSPDGLAKTMAFAVELLLPASSPRGEALKQTRVRYELVLARRKQPSGIEAMIITHERLAGIQRADDVWMACHPALMPFALYEEEQLDLDLDKCLRDGGDARFESSRRFLREELRETKRRRSAALSLAFFGVLPLLQATANALQKALFVQLHHAALREPGLRIGDWMEPDGADLPSALAALDPNSRATLSAELAEIIPGFRSFQVVPVENELHLEVEFTDGQRLPARVLSDGTLRLFALLAFLRTARPGGLIAIEEPENGIHPGSLRALMSRLIDATTCRGELPPQVLLNSHSPAIVAALFHQPSSIVFADLVRRRDGLRSTRMRHVRAQGEPSDRGATSVSLREVERLLDTARPEEHEA